MKHYDDIEHPKHYNMYPVEAKELTAHLSFPCGSTIKYLWRYPHKGAAMQDLGKAIEYLQIESQREFPIALLPHDLMQSLIHKVKECNFSSARLAAVQAVLEYSHDPVGHKYLLATAAKYIEQLMTYDDQH